jgi:CheY-like chemotaxis protein
MKNNVVNLLFIVDDDPDDRQVILDAFLEHAAAIQYQLIESASDLMANLRSAEQPWPALILLDLNMPGMQGMQALRQIRSDEGFNHLPVVVLTTSSLESDRRSAYNSGANCYLSKPDAFGPLVEIARSLYTLWLNGY